MKLVTFAHQDQQRRVGWLDANQRVVDLSEALGGRSLIELLPDLGTVEQLAETHSTSGALPTYDLTQVQLLAPVSRPNSLRDCMAFEGHLINCTRTVVRWKLPPAVTLDRWCQRAFGRGFLRPPRVWYQRPVYYKGNPDAVVGHDAAVRWPAYTDRLDFELEFGIFIGKRGRDISEEAAADHIAGYAIFNDFSARDVQLSEMQGRLGPAKGKDFDTSNAIGPWLVTRDEIPDARNLTMTARVNGDVWCEANSGDMHYSFEEIIAYISRDETLHPGDFIGAGTAPGGCGLELDRWLQPGDVVELEVERLGTLRNRVVRNHS